MLFGGGPPPRAGLGVDLGVSYATLSRRQDLIPGRFDTSDVTAKLAVVGIGQARLSPENLGAGTPEREWRIHLAVGPSHDEVLRKVSNEEPVTASGTGRYLGFAALGRLPIGPRDSVELGFERRDEDATDLFILGKRTFDGSRSGVSRRLDLGGGWRHRWHGLEAAAGLRWGSLTGGNETGETLYRAHGGLLGGAAEVRLRVGRLGSFLRAERMSGSLNVRERSVSASVDRDRSRDAVLQTGSAGLSYSWPRTDLALSLSSDRQRLPFVSLAVLGTEASAFDRGLHPESDVREVFWNVVLRRSFTPALRALAQIRLGYGTETVTLSDPSGGSSPMILNIRRRGTFGAGLSGQLGSPAVVFYVGVEVALGRPADGG